MVEDITMRADSPTRHSTKRPLTGLKQFPPLESGASKRPLSMTPSSSPQKRLKSPTEQLALNIHSPLFKASALPSRLQEPLTPSTSTVAFTSSPRHALSSSPIRGLHVPSAPKRKVGRSFAPFSSSIDQEIIMEQEMTLIFGRHRHKQSSNQRSSTSVINLTSSVKRSLIHLLDSRTKPARIINLPRQASHASRVHAVVEYLVSSDQIRIIVLGLNGVRVKSVSSISNNKAIRLVEGQRMDFSRSGHENAGVEINFYGSRVVVRFPLLAASTVRAESRSTSPMSDAPSSPSSRQLSSLPPSSPPFLHSDLEEEEEELLEADQEPSQHDGEGTSSPLTVSSEMSEEEEPNLFDTRPSKAIKLEALVAVASEEQALQAVSRAQTPVVEVRPQKPESIDLPALLASTVVFSGSSKLSLPDLVKGMLESQPSLRELGSEALWSFWASDELESNAMFGKVSRVGKDASGHPLLPHYFYNPDSDPDASRAVELGRLVRPLRAAQRAGGKAIDWRPVGSGRRRY